MDTITRETSLRLQSNDEACYLFDEQELISNIRSMQMAFGSSYKKFQLAYSFKTNYLARICKTMMWQGCMAEVVSPEEYKYARLLGFEPEKIIFNGVAPDFELKYAAAKRGAMVNVDNYGELLRIVRIAEVNGEEIKLGVRVNFPISNGLVSRFGIDVDSQEFKKTMVLLNTNRYVKFSGFHCHIGSARPVKFWEEKAARMAELAEQFGAEYVDLGGGLYGPMIASLSAQFDDYEGKYNGYAYRISEQMKRHFPDEDCLLIIEPGTALVGNTMMMAATVTNVKEARGKTFVTVNANSNQLGVIADMKELPTEVIHCSKPMSDRMYAKHATVCGNTCLEYDYLARDFNGLVTVGDRILFKNVGAYSISSSRQFIVPRPAVREASTFETLRTAENVTDVFGKYLDA